MVALAVRRLIDVLFVMSADLVGAAMIMSAADVGLGSAGVER
jgi:hypothetical protein